jgi:hypothetical protein
VWGPAAADLVGDDVGGLEAEMLSLLSGGAVKGGGKGKGGRGERRGWLHDLAVDQRGML